MTGRRTIACDGAAVVSVLAMESRSPPPADANRSVKEAKVANQARIVGIHPIAADEPVHLVELEIVGSADEFDFGDVTQEVPDQPRSNWQVPYDERKIASEPGCVRSAFFFHYLDTSKPLLSPAGPLELPPETPVPEHLQDAKYEQP